jgi:hypothetical protein
VITKVKRELETISFSTAILPKQFFSLIETFRKRKILFITKVSFWSQSYQILISSFFWFSLLSLAILKYRQYFCMLQTLKLNNKKWKKSLFYEEKSLVGLTPERKK